LFKCSAKGGHFCMQFVGHRGASRFIVREPLVSPAAVACLVIEYRHRVCRLAVNNQQIQRVLASFYTGRSLYGMNAAD
jgi:hypothetical protein